MRSPGLAAMTGPGPAEPADGPAAWLAAATARHRGGDLDGAAALYRRVLDRVPEHPLALQRLALIGCQTGVPASAVALVRGALAAVARGSWPGAVDLVACHDTLGTALAAVGDPNGAAAAHRAALALAPARAALWFNLANALKAGGAEAKTAAAALGRAVACDPCHAAARIGRANALAALGRAATAAGEFRAALALAPGHADALHGLGEAMAARGDDAAAVAPLRWAAAMAPTRAALAYRLAVALAEAGDRPGAIAACRATLAHDPGFAAAHDTLGSLIDRDGRPQAAVPCHRTAVALAPAVAPYHYNLANTARRIGRPEEAEQGLARARALDPTLAVARYNHAMVALGLGPSAEAWAAYDLRFTAGDAQPQRAIARPSWTGARLVDGRLLVWREQGIGDEVMFARHYPAAAARVGTDRLVIEAEPRLVAPIGRALPGVAVRAAADPPDPAADRSPPPDLACHLPAGSLARLVAPTLAAVGRDLAPILVADPDAARHWAARLAALPPGLKVGVAWRSALITEDRRSAYTALADWAPVLTVPGCVPVNLQYDDCAAELAAVERALGRRIAVWSELDLRHDLDAVVALIAGLDLVITAPTSVGELAGGVGVPVWRLTEPREWTMLGTGCRPWYPTMRVFARRSPESWAGVLARVARSLGRLRAAARPPAHRDAPKCARTTAPVAPTATVLLDRAIAAHRAGALDRALRDYRRVLAAEPDQVDAMHLCGLALHQAGRSAEARPLIRAALVRTPGFAQAFHHLGLVERALRRPAPAMRCLAIAVALAPDHAAAISHLARLAQDTAPVAVVEAQHRRALALDPALADAHANLGYLYETEGRYHEAERWYLRVIRLKPALADGHNNVGRIRQALSRPASAWFERALALDPGHALASWNRGLIRLARGELAGGWADITRRFETEALAPGRRLPVPRWDGTPLAGRRLLVWGEQGLGDEILFATCYGDLARFAAGGAIRLDCDRRLVELFRRAFPFADTRAAPDEAPSPRDSADPIDLQLAAGDLPGLVRPRLAAFPVGTAAVFSADPAQVAAWRERVAALGPGLKIGICWRSQVITAGRRASYTRLEDWAAVFAVPGCRFVSLQYGRTAEELARHRRRSGAVPIATWPDLDLKDDLEGVAALMTVLDLVVTAPTAVGELAAALGVPVWRFDTGDEAWSLLGTQVRPWYPTMGLFSDLSEPGRGGQASRALPGIARRLRRLAAMAARPAAPPRPRSPALPPSAPPAPDTTAAATPTRPALERRLASAAARHQAGDLATAAALYREVLAVDRTHPVALHLLGLVRQAEGAPQAAMKLIARAVHAAPAYVAAWINLGTVLQALGRHGDAVEAYRRALAQRPEAADALTNLGNALDSLDRLEEAASCHRRAIVCVPETATAHANLGQVLWRRRQLAAAEAAVRRALALDPRAAAALGTLGTIVRDLGRPAEAERCYRAALALAPDDPPLLSDLSRVLTARGATAEAYGCLTRALSRAPTLPSAQVNLALLRLGQGALAEGWPGYEHRFAARDAGVARRPIETATWRGEPLTGRTLLVWPEQGLGDELMFATLVPALGAAAADGRLALECDPRLVALYRRSFVGATVAPLAPTARATAPSTAGPSDLQIAAGSVPGRLATSLAAWPTGGAPLAADSAAVAGWRAALAALGPGLRVGLCWRSGDLSPDRRASYARLETWAPLLRVPGVVWVNLQYGRCEDELAAAERRLGVAVARFAALDRADDLDGLAALISALDLVISAPTAVGELAGCLGVPVWRIDRAGDWTTLGTRVRPWFPAMRLFADRALPAALARAGRALARAAAPRG